LRLLAVLIPGLANATQD